MYDFASWDAGIHSKDPNSLQHYGVLGMKWGMRRYQNEDGSLTAAGEKHYQKTGERGYHYHSHATKKYTKKAARAKANADKYRESGNETKQAKVNNKVSKSLAKAEKYAKRAKRSAELDKHEEEYARKISTGKAIVGSLLLGSDRLKGYAQYRGMADIRHPGEGRGSNMTGQKVAAGIKAYRGGSASSRLAKAAYLREGEKPNSLGQKAYRLNNKITDRYADMQDKAAKAHGGFPDREKQNKKKKS